MIKDIIDIALGAGEILREGFGKSHNIEYKGIANIVTEIDHRSEAYIVGEILRRFHDHSILAEESGSLNGRARSCWYIDPLDGTTNYAHNLPIFSVSIAYACAGEILMGVVYDPMRQECFSAERGHGAWLNGEQIKVSQINSLSNSLMVTGFSYGVEGHGADSENNELYRTSVEHFLRMLQSCFGIRRLGSAALDFAYVAAGRFEGFWEAKLSPWDVAAGSLLVQEAGGVVTTLKGEDNYLLPPCSIVTANPALHSLMMTELNQKVPK